MTSSTSKVGEQGTPAPSSSPYELKIVLAYVRHHDYNAGELRGKELHIYKLALELYTD
jgi:hypothetical protein